MLSYSMTKTTDDLSYVKGQVEGLKESIAALRTDVATCSAQSVAVAELKGAVSELIEWKRSMQSQLFKLIVIVALAALGGSNAVSIAKALLPADIPQAAAAHESSARP